jgi:uncharacterized protein (DUF885 family)
MARVSQGFRLLAIVVVAVLAVGARLGYHEWRQHEESLRLAAPGANSSLTSQPRPVAEFFAQFTADWVRADPDLAVRSRYFSGEEQNRLEQQLTPQTREHELEVIERARAGLAELARFDRAQMTDTERVAADVMRWQLETLVASEPFSDYSFPLQQFNGANVELVNTFTVAHPLVTAQDSANYVQRLAQVDDRLREATAEAARRSDAGIRPPVFILTATVRQMERFVAVPPSNNPLVATLRDKMAGIAELAEERRAELEADAIRVVTAEVYPAWQAALVEVQRQLPLATDDAGLWRFPNGADIYAYQLARFTTTSLTAEEIHAIGLREVARIEAEMDALFRQIGMTEGSVKQRAEALRVRLAYPETDAGRAALMADIDSMLADAQERSAALFERVPRAPVIAQPYPRFRWENAAASYTPAPLDGSRPGVFQMPLRPDQLTRFRLRSLVYHETVPGHHYQIALIGENPNIPRFIQIRAFGGISAITEGWALYAERLAAESNWYVGDVEGRLGQLESALFRARRLVVDTGLHAMGWTRAQAIDYGLVPSEVERYVVNPGQACAYMIGQLEIVELRERTRAALGDDFSLREFHTLVLDVGAVPLTVLEQAVERYIAAR